MSGDSERKREVLEALRTHAPELALAAVALSALATETSRTYTADLMCAVVRHEGGETIDEDGARWYNTDALARCYERALHGAETPDVRIALHWGYSGFHPRDSKDGRMSSTASNRVEQQLRSAADDEERAQLIKILTTRSSAPLERLRAEVNRQFDDGRMISREFLTMWEQVMTRDREAWDWSRTQDEASRRLGAALARAESNDVRARMLGMLDEEFFSDASESIFNEHLDDADGSVREAAVRALAHFDVRGRDRASRVLAGDRDTGPLEAAWRVLESAGTDQRSILHAIAKNPNADASARVILNHVRGSDWKPWDILRNAWPGLPPHLRDALLRLWRFDHHRFFHRMHHPVFEELYFGLERNFVGATSPGLRALAASLLYASDDRLDPYDLDAVTGLTRRRSVEFVTFDLVRFQFIADSRSRDGVPLADVLDGVQIDVHALADLEEAFDRDREALAATRAAIAQLERELGFEFAAMMRQRTEEDLRRPARGRSKPWAFLKNAAPRYLELEARYVRLYDSLFSANGEGPYARLYYASRRALPVLREVGCSFAGMAAPDGVFAEYDPTDHAIALFPPMIELGALEAAHEIQRPLEEVHAHIRTIVEVHELAHAQMHLGEDASGAAWHSPGRASRAFHEAIATSYTRRLLRRMNAPELMAVLRVVDAWLPTEYRWADLLESASPEELRSFVVARRAAEPTRRLDEIAGTVLRSVPGYVEMIRAQAGTATSSLFQEPVAAFISAANEAESAEGASLIATLAQLVECAGALPHGKALFGPLIAGGWPSVIDSRWLLFDALTDGEPVGVARLRIIRRDDFRRAVASARSSVYLDLRPAIRESRTAAEALLAFAGREPDDEHFGPSERRPRHDRRATKRKTG